MPSKENFIRLANQQRKVYLFVFGILSSISSINFCFAQQTQNISPWGTKFLLYTPPSYIASPSTPAPLLVYLHGGGSIGNDLTLLTGTTVSDKAPPYLIENGAPTNKYPWPTSRPFIVLSPQLKRDLKKTNKNDQEWSMDSVNEVIEYVRSNYNVDANRIYLTGMSLGGAACWKYAATYPSKIAGIVPFSGKTDVTQACIIKDIPIWAFHGDNDRLVDPPFTISMVDSINACKPSGNYKTHLNLLIARPHEGWDEVWNGTDGYQVFDWLLQFSKNNFSNKPPFVSVGDNITLIQGNDPVHLYGEYFDPDGSISNVSWTQTSGNAVSLNGTNSHMLEISNLPVGTYEFELRVTDNLGLQNFDRAVITILANAGGTDAAVSDIYLVNGFTDLDIMPLSEGLIINTTSLGTTQYNLRAEGTVNIKSVRFKANSDQNVRTTNGPPFMIMKPNTNIEWVITNGDYNICATPYKSNAGGGTPGISKCFKITVTDEIISIKNFYSKPGTDISSLTSWGTNTDGSGTPPVSFSDNYQNFVISNTCNSNNPLIINGVQSNILVKAGGTLTLNNSLSGTLNTESTAIVYINTNQPITFGTISSTSLINFGQNAISIPPLQYGNIRIMGNGTSKTLASDTTTISGTLTVDSGVILNGSTSTILKVNGDVTLNETGSINPATKYSLFFSNPSSQQFNIKSTQANFNQITVVSGNSVQVNNSVGTTTFQLGSTSGGGLLLNNGAQLKLGKNNLSIINKGTINTSNQTGQLGFYKSSFNITSTATTNSNLYTIPNSDTLKVATFDLSASSLNIQSKLYISDSLKSKNGTIHSNGNISLVSTATSTARIGRVEGTGTIEGDVEVQRFIEKERLYKYMSFPLTNNTIKELQDFIPVTGPFIGASSGPGISSGNPSMYYYNEPGGGWIRYPNANRTEPLEIGKGYSIYLRNDVTDTKVALSGPIHQGDFSFTLTPDPNTSNNNDGWNLVGNPYASRIKWGTTGWTSSGVSSSIYIRDNSIGGGRFYTWNGTSGDVEFKGIIPLGQAFWVRTTDGSPSLIVSENAKTSSGTGELFRTMGDQPDLKLLTIELNHKNLTDRTFFEIRPNVLNEFDKNDDAIKQLNSYYNLSSLTTDSVKLAINNLSSADCNHEVRLLTEVSDSGDYTFTMNGSLLENNSRMVTLIDSYLDSTVFMNNKPEYKFKISSNPLSHLPTRFKLKIEALQNTPIISLNNNALHSSSDENNQWLFNGSEIEGATSSSYSPTETGSYQVRVNTICSTTSAPVEYIVTEIDNNQHQNITIYPNPAATYLHIKGEVKTGNTIKYSVVDLLGRIIQTGFIQDEDFFFGTEIDLPNIKPGMHVLILQGKGLTHIHKFSKD